MSRTRKLDPVEIRVLGVLLEKEQATPDHYPLTTNAVLAGCNQKSNRDPVMELSETEVTEALDRLREDVLVWRSASARAERWEHRLDRRWELDARSKAIMTLLLLRGPQTPGELRSRSERLCSFDSVDQVEEILRELSGGFDALVCELPRRPGQREARWMHLESTEGDPREAEAAWQEPERPAAAATPTTRPSQRAASDESAERIASLEEAVEELRSTVAELSEQVRDLRAQLGLD